MTTLRLLLWLIIPLTFNSCGDNSSVETTKPKITYNAYAKTNSGDTINRTNEKGKQGLWVYTKADGSTTDTVYKDGIPQK